MMGWLGRSTSTPGGFVDRKRVEAGAAFSSLENHWKQAKAVMDNLNAQSAADALTVISHLSQMVSFLRLTKNDDLEQNCKKFWIQNQCSDKVIQWLHALQIKGTQLEYEDEKKLVQTLESFCELVSHDGELLGFAVSQRKEEEDEFCSWDAACSLSSLLLEYSLKDDPSLGEPARNSFIMLIQLTSKYPELEKSFSNHTGLELTNVVISGLSACFAQLPTFYAGSSEQIEPFITQLKFVDSVTYAGPSTISLTIANCFSNAFLQAVILPALTQDEGNRSLHSQDDHFVTSLHEEIAIVTNYLKIVCEHLTHPLLIKSLMDFILNYLLSDLLKRMNHQNVSVTVSTLGLISVLLTFYCEDFWYELILRHLMDQSHLMVSQRTIRLPEIDYQDASLRFLSLIPAQVVEAIGPEAIRLHYSQYLDNELTRLPIFFSREFPISINSYLSRNAVFPMWKYKYDGTDEIVPTLTSLKSHNLFQSSSTNNTPTNEEIGESNASPQKSPVNEDPLTSEARVSFESKAEPFTTISLQPTDEQLHSLGAASNANSEDSLNPSLTNDNGRASDGYGSLETESNSNCLPDNSASFCPFLDILLIHLKNLNKLPPDMILMVTDIISTLAGSRIPLVTSILLDTNLILQPSYVSFPLLLNRIRVEFDQNIKEHFNTLVEVWNSFSKVLAASQHDTAHNLSLSSSMSMNFMHSLSNSFDTSFGDGSFTESIKKKISNNSSIGPFLNNVFHRKSSTGSVSRNTLPSSSPRQGGHNVNGSELNENDMGPPSPSNHQIYRLKTGQSLSFDSPSTPHSKQSAESIRLMATRALYFSHWLLEMASIAQQLCWKRPLV